MLNQLIFYVQNYSNTKFIIPASACGGADQLIFPADDESCGKFLKKTRHLYINELTYGMHIADAEVVQYHLG